MWLTSTSRIHPRSPFRLSTPTSAAFNTTTSSLPSASFSTFSRTSSANRSVEERLAKSRTNVSTDSTFGSEESVRWVERSREEERPVTKRRQRGSVCELAIWRRNSRPCVERVNVRLEKGGNGDGRCPSFRLWEVEL